jgi:hypothetical protein
MKRQTETTEAEAQKKIRGIWAGAPDKLGRTWFSLFHAL